MWLVHGTKKGALPLGLDKRKYGKHVTVISNVTLPERLSAELQQSLSSGPPSGEGSSIASEEY